MVFAYTIYDYLDSPIVINIDAVITNDNSIFPAVSVCIEKFDNYRANTERIKNFVQKYYSEQNIEEPQE